MSFKIILKQFYTSQKFYSATYFFSVFLQEKKKSPIYIHIHIDGHGNQLNHQKIQLV